MFSLYVIADRGVFSDDQAWLDALRTLGSAIGRSPATALQVRVKNEPPARRAELLASARSALGPVTANTLLNGSLTEALCLGFGGVHWPEAMIPERRPAGLPTRFVVGASIHSREALQRAERADATFALFGPVFAPGTKPVAGQGIDALAGIVRDARLPLLAVGGITPVRVRACIAAGAAGVGVVTGILLAPEPLRAMAAYAEVLHANRVAGRYPRPDPVPGSRR